MKTVHIRRHAPKHATGELTEEGKKLAASYNAQLEKFDLVIASDKPRAIETARLLTGREPSVDRRAGTPPFTPEQEKTLHELGLSHEHGIAGVILDNPQYRAMIKPQGESLAALIRETIGKLPDGGRALIISHDGVMVTAERILKDKPLDKADKTFAPLKGFTVSDDGNITDLD